MISRIHFTLYGESRTAYVLAISAEQAQLEFADRFSNSKSKLDVDPSQTAPEFRRGCSEGSLPLLASLLIRGYKHIRRYKYIEPRLNDEPDFVRYPIIESVITEETSLPDDGELFYCAKRPLLVAPNWRRIWNEVNEDQNPYCIVGRNPYWDVSWDRDPNIVHGASPAKFAQEVNPPPILVFDSTPKMVQFAGDLEGSTLFSSRIERLVRLLDQRFVSLSISLPAIKLATAYDGKSCLGLRFLAGQVVLPSKAAHVEVDNSPEAISARLCARRPQPRFLFPMPGPTDIKAWTTPAPASRSDVTSWRKVIRVRNLLPNLVDAPEAVQLSRGLASRGKLRWDDENEQLWRINIRLRPTLVQLSKPFELPHGRALRVAHLAADGETVIEPMFDISTKEFPYAVQSQYPHPTEFRDGKQYDKTIDVRRQGHGPDDEDFRETEPSSCRGDIVRIEKERFRFKEEPTVVTPRPVWEQPSTEQPRAPIRCCECGAAHMTKENITYLGSVCTFRWVRINKDLLCNRPACKVTRDVPDLCRDEDRVKTLFEPTAEQIASWFKRHTIEKDGKRVFREPDKRSRRLMRFQPYSHANWMFPNNSDGKAEGKHSLVAVSRDLNEEGTKEYEDAAQMRDAEDGLLHIDLHDEQQSSDSPDDEHSFDKIIDKYGSVSFLDSGLQSRPATEVREYDDWESVGVRGPEQRAEQKKTFVVYQSGPAAFGRPTQVRSKQRWQKVDEYRDGGSLALASSLPLKAEIRKWNERLLRSFQRDFEAEFNARDLEYEKWRREALRLKGKGEFKDWWESFEPGLAGSMPRVCPPSYAAKYGRCVYTPEIRGKIKFIIKGKSRTAPNSTHWYDHAFEGLALKTFNLSRRAVDLFLADKENPGKFAPLLRIIRGGSDSKLEARLLGIKEKTMAKRVQRIAKEIMDQQLQNGIFDVRKLSREDLGRIDEERGLWIILPGDKKNRLEIHKAPHDCDVPLKSVNDSIDADRPDLAAMAIGLAQDTILGGLRMQLYRQLANEINARAQSRGSKVGRSQIERNRAFERAKRRLDEKFEVAEIKYFGPKESKTENAA